MPDTPDSAALIVEANTLIFQRFDEDLAFALGLKTLHLARAEGARVVVDIRNGQRCFFHVALPGATALNDRWVERKSATALLFHEASLLVGTRNREKGETLARHGLSSEAYADNGGAVPIVVAGSGMVACLTVSGLPQLEDHRLAVRAIRAVLDEA